MFGLEIPRTVAALKRDHLTRGTQSLKMQQTYMMNAQNDRECDSENFGARITEIRVTVEKIWLKEVLGTYLQFQNVPRANFGKFQGSVLKMVDCGWILNKGRDLNAKCLRLFSNMNYF
jgi:hypothetical protein